MFPDRLANIDLWFQSVGIDLWESTNSMDVTSGARFEIENVKGKKGAAPVGGGSEPLGASSRNLGDRLDELVVARYAAGVWGHCTHCTFVITCPATGPLCWTGDAPFG